MIQLKEEEKKKLWEWLINGVAGKPGFGPISDWGENHWQHIQVYMHLLLDQNISSVTKELAKKYENIIEEARKIAKNKGYESIGLISEVMNSDLTEDSKGKIVKLAYDNVIKQQGDAFEAIDSFLLNINVIPSKPVGRQKINRDAFLKWLDYLTEERGNYTQAISYAVSHPMLKLGEQDTIIREYRRYRNKI